jgi:hypothetical protein
MTGRPLPSIAPEVDWVVSALRVRYGEDPGPVLREPPRDLDWDLVFATAHRNAVVQLVEPVARELTTVPAPAMAQLEAEARRITLANLDAVAELIRVLDLLGAAGITGLPFKGPVLARTAYGDVGSRRFLDLDVLVDPDTVPAALEVLGAAGYRPVFDLTDRQWRAARRHEHAAALVDGAGHLFELHWAIADRASMLPRDCGPLFDRATTVSLGGRQVATLDPTDQLAIVAIHGGRHLWERLAWVCDVAEAAATPGADPDRAYDMARGAGYGKAVPVAFRVAERVLGTPAPTKRLRRAAAARSIEATCDAVLPLVLAPGGPERASARTFARQRARIMDRRSAALRGMVRATVTPTASDWGVVRLPDALWPVYYPVRLGRLLASYVAGDRRPGDAGLGTP